MRLVLSLLAGVVSALQSESLTILNCLADDPQISPREVFERIRYEMPGSFWTEQMVRNEMARYLKPVQVPTWFHEILSLAGSIEKFIPELEKRLTRRFPKKNHLLEGLSPSFVSIEAMHHTASVWFTHCVEPMQVLPDITHCYETEVVIDGIEMIGWKLSPERMQIYFSHLALEEARFAQAIDDEQLEANVDSFLKLLESADNLTPTNSENSPSWSGNTSHESASSSGSDIAEATENEKPRKSLKRQYATIVRNDETRSLLNMLRNDTEQFKREVNIVVSGIVPSTERARERFEILEPVVQPTWFHVALTLFEGRLFHDNKILETDLKLVGGQLFSPRIMQFVEPWSKWCIQPLMRGDSTACTPLTVQQMNRGIVHWTVLSNERILAYLEDQLQQH